MNNFSVYISMLIINAVALLCLIRKTDADEVMGKRKSEGSPVKQINRPYFVFIETYEESKEKPTPCDGVLIDTDTVLSAARCFYPYEKLTKVLVKVGNFKHTSNSKEGRKKEIEAVSVEVYDKMKSYKDEPGSKWPPDIARLKLASAAVGKKDVLRPCGRDFWSDKENSLIDQRFNVVGMGEANLEGKKPDVLQTLNIYVTKTELGCSNPKSSRFFDNIDRFCVVGFGRLKSGRGEIEPYRPISGACHGDYGCPVIPLAANKPACLVGVLNQGIRVENSDNEWENVMLFTSIRNLGKWVESKQFTEIFQKKLPSVSKKFPWEPLKSFIGIGTKIGKGTTKVPK